MNEAIRTIAEEAARSLNSVGERLISAVAASGWSPDSNIHTNYNYAAMSMSVSEIANELSFSSSRIIDYSWDGMSEETALFLNSLTIRAQTLNFSNFTASPISLMAAALELANAVSRHVPLAPAAPSPPPKAEIDWEDLKDRKDLLPRDLSRRLRGIADQLDDLEPRTTALAAIITEIEQARETAEQLPTDMADLSARRTDMRRMSAEATKLAASIATISEQVAASKKTIDVTSAASEKRLADVEAKADGALQRAERALSGSTSAGLARAFEQRRKSLAFATLAWTGGLALALSLGIIIGADRLAALRTVLVDNKSASVIWANVLLTLVGVGAPIWFAWLSTKQIGTTFRLSEDYAFKATVSQAYEGYRSEAVDMDPALRSRLFEAALDRFEEAPIRLVELTNHSTPMQEFLAHPSVKKQLDAFPDITGEAITFIKGKMAAATALAGAAASTAAAAASVAASAQKAPAASDANKPD